MRVSWKTIVLETTAFGALGCFLGCSYHLVLRDGKVSVLTTGIFLVEVFGVVVSSAADSARDMINRDRSKCETTMEDTTND